MESSELQEGLFKAIQTIAKSEVNKMSFDKTLVCTILNTSEAARGKYYVTDKSSKFYAYSEITTYEKGEVVLVKVPNGDFNNQKHIEGRYVSEQGEDYNYVSPYTQFVSYTTNLIDNPGVVGQLLTNFQGNKFRNVQQSDINTEPKHSNTGVLWKASKISEIEGYDYDVMYLAADFKTLIGSNNQEDIQLKSGYYGIKLLMDMTYLDMNGHEVTNTNVSFYLDNTDMNGNAYDFETYYKQEKLFYLEKKYVKHGLRLSNVRVLFFQGDNDNTIVFKNLNDNLVRWYKTEQGEKILDNPNLFVTNIDLQFGYKQEKVDTDKIVIDVKKKKGAYGTEGQNPNALSYYSYIPEDEMERLKNKGHTDWYIQEHYNEFLENYNKKTIYINKKQSYIELLKIRNPDQINLRVDLYRYLDPKYGVQSKSNNSDAGENWELVSLSPNNSLDVTYTFDPDISREEERFKAIVYYESPVGSDEVVDPDTGEILTPDTKHKTLISNELVFSLVGEVQKPQNEYLVIDCDNDGIFKIYDLKGRLINNFEKYKKRYLYAHKENNSEATLRSITWRIPYKNSMIVPISYEEFMEGYSQNERGYEKNEEEGVIYYTIYNPKELEFYFRIKDYLSSTDINNTIYCTAKFNTGASYEVIAKTIEFCTIDYFGTKYKLDMRFENGRSSIPVGQEQWVQVRVLNAENIDITKEIIAQGLQFGLEWYSKPEESTMTVSQIDQNNFRFLLNAEEDVVYGKRITENGYRIRQVENEDAIRIIEDTVGDQGDLNYTETRVTEKDLTSPYTQHTRITDNNEIRRTEINYSLVPDLAKYFGSHILRADIQGFESRDDDNPEDSKANREKITIVGYFPIPVASSASYIQYIGPSQILYDSNGANPAYYKGVPELYYIDDKNVEHQNEDVTWEIKYADSIDADFAEYELSIPRRILKVPPVIVEGRKCINILARSKKDNSVLWIQPIPIMKDIWDDKVLNSWQNFDIQSVVAGMGQLEKNGKLSGIFLGQAIDSKAIANLERKKANVLSQLQTNRDNLADAYATLDFLYTLPQSPETDAEIENYVEVIIPGLEEQQTLLETELEDINKRIERSSSITGLYGIHKDNMFFRLTEDGEFGIDLSDLSNNNFVFESPHITIDCKEDQFKIDTNFFKLVEEEGDENDKLVIATPILRVNTETERFRINSGTLLVDYEAAHDNIAETRKFRVATPVLKLNSDIENNSKVLSIGDDFYISAIENSLTHEIETTMSCKKLEIEDFTVPSNSIQDPLFYASTSLDRFCLNTETFSINSNSYDKITIKDNNSNTLFNLDKDGNIYTVGTLQVKDDVIFEQDLSVYGDLSVYDINCNSIESQGALTINGNVFVKSGELTVQDHLDNIKFKVYDSSGNIYTAGELQVDDDASIDGELTVGSNANVQGNISADNLILSSTSTISFGNITGLIPIQIEAVDHSTQTTTTYYVIGVEV